MIETERYKAYMVSCEKRIEALKAMDVAKKAEAEAASVQQAAYWDYMTEGESDD